MNQSYADIRDAIVRPPLWFDECAVPRYCQFTPTTVDIYANEVAFLRIRCQGCHHPFDVAMSQSRLDERATLTEQVLDGSIHYGDPPNIGCCDIGLAMNSEPLRVLEFWRNIDGKWLRVPELEVELPE